LAKEILAKSSQQYQAAEKHNKLVMEAGNELDAQKQAVFTLKDTLNCTGIKDNKINVKLRELQGNSKKRELLQYRELHNLK